jgi:exosortase A-associated hydrolase 1
MNSPEEKAVIFQSGDASLLGVVHPAHGSARPEGVLIVVGGPQYRVGSHRQFVITARSLAQRGCDVFRFDCRGMGDSGGMHAGFERCGDDIRAAIDTFLAQCPHLQGVHLFGLCDGASAALMYAPQDSRVRGLILANPWVRTESSQAGTYLRHYYVTRFFQASFWRKVLKGSIDVRKSLGSLADNVQRSRAGGATENERASTSYVVRMREALRDFSGRVLLLLSGDDLTAREFVDLYDRHKQWIAAAKRAQVSRHDLPKADHTFSRRSSLDRANALCADWLQGGGIAK